jgi:hypothetical protein
VRSFLWIFVFVVVLPTVILAICYAFSRAPSLLIAILWQGVVLGVIALVMGVMTNRNSVVATANGGFDVRAFALYKFHANGNPRQPDHVVADMRQLGETAPVIRTNGISIPRYHAGWFRTRDGRRAFLAVTDSKAPIAVFDNVDDKGTVLVVSQALIDES